jgi:hypothetical protein
LIVRNGGGVALLAGASVASVSSLSSLPLFSSPARFRFFLVVKAPTTEDNAAVDADDADDDDIIRFYSNITKKKGGTQWFVI